MQHRSVPASFLVPARPATCLLFTDAHQPGLLAFNPFRSKGYIVHPKRDLPVYPWLNNLVPLNACASTLNALLSLSCAQLLTAGAR